MHRLRGVVSVLVLLAVETCQFSRVPSSHFGTFDFLEVENAAYVVEISSAPVPESQIHQNTQEESDVTYMSVLSKHGQLYSCSIPPPLGGEEEEETEPLAESLPNVTTLLKPLTERECLLKTVGWWTYEYCHEMFVRQYHVEAGRIVGETKYLGYYEKETVWDQSHIARVKGLLDSFKDNLAGSQPQAYHSVYYVNGTECDITRQPRSSKVEIFCSVEGVDKMIELKEETTCNYTLRIQTPLLCQHPILMPLKNSAPSHTLSCSPVVSQLDYEDYLLKEELIRQQKEKISALQSSDDKTSEEKGESLLNADHKLLRKLVMSSITQLAEIAYDVGSMNDQESYDGEDDLDEIGDDDKEVGVGGLRSDRSKSERQSSLGREGSGERGPVSSEVKVHRDEGSSHEEAEEGGKVSEKMKKMANDVKSTGKDSALESLLSNLAVTAQYIESLENDDESPLSSENTTPKEASDVLEQHEDNEHILDEGATTGDTSVKGPPPVQSDGRTGRTSESEEHAATPSRSGSGGTQRSTGKSISSEILAAGGLEEGEEEEEGEEFDLDAELVREMEQHLEETIAKQLNTKDVTVKIITLPEDHLNEEGEVGASDRTIEDRDSDMSNAMSRLLDSLLNGEEPESEDRQRQYNLEASYHHVWGKDRRKGSR